MIDRRVWWAPLVALAAACTPYQAEAPQGFAAFSGRGPFRAVSPDGVSFRVRHEANEPEADLSFWSEALKKRMDDAGYRFIGERDITASGVKGFALELAAPFGQQDYSYLVAIFVQRGDIIIVESAGEVTLFAQKRAAIDSAISALQF